MSRIKTEKLHQELLKKKEKYSVRVTMHIDSMPVTARIKGLNKNRFINDCILREINESKMLGYIVDAYYSFIDVYPNISDKEPDEIKKFIIDRIKLE